MKGTETGLWSSEPIQEGLIGTVVCKLAVKGLEAGLWSNEPLREGSIGTVICIITKLAKEEPVAIGCGKFIDMPHNSGRDREGNGCVA